MALCFDDAMTVQDILDAASTALGQSLSEPVDLGGSSRSTVVRARAGDGASVIVKAYKKRGDAQVSIGQEAAGLAFAAPQSAGSDSTQPAGDCPRLLATDLAWPLVVMSDLGSASSLADLLLGSDPQAAQDGLAAWAAACGRMAARSVGREAEFTRLLSAYSADPRPTGAERGIQNAAELAEVLDEYGITPPPGLEREVVQATAAFDESDSGPGAYRVFSPGDICPDNALITADGAQLLDFEGAGFHAVFREAVYTRMPFTTCWCATRLPQAVAERTEQAYRDEVVRAYPDLSDDAVWLLGMATATVAWTAALTATFGHMLRREDGSMHRDPTLLPTGRQLARHRWSHVTAQLDEAGSGLYPAFAETCRLLVKASEEWDLAPAPLYPAFREGRGCC
ncbi:MAG TPA: hypothetical protein VGM10_20095 [Actinocrinis sp.]|jgi:hypothetical protein